VKMLIDENLPRKLVARLQAHECRTVVECGWSGKNNGELLALADPLFDVLLTLDRNLPYQQNLDSIRIVVLIIHAYSNRPADLLPLLPECLAVLETIQPRQVVRVGSVSSR
jgi:hypothetical protein